MSPRPPPPPASDTRRVRAAPSVPRRVYAAEMALRLRPAGDLPDGDESAIAFNWNWRLVDGALNVLFGLKVEPTSKRNEEIEALMVGVFSLPDESPIHLDHFVAQNAVVTLFPFLREAISSLTMRGFFGPWLFPLVNTVSLARQFDITDTDGFRQLAEDPGLRERVSALLSPAFVAALEAAAKRRQGARKRKPGKTE